MDECCICLEQRLCFRVLSCKHHVCQMCCRVIDKCPLCRAPIDYKTCTWSVEWKHIHDEIVRRITSTSHSTWYGAVIPVPLTEYLQCAYRETWPTTPYDELRVTAYRVLVYDIAYAR